MTLAGVWRIPNQRTTLLIREKESSHEFQFQFIADEGSTVLSEGVLQLLPSGDYLGTVPGVNAARFMCRLVQPDVLKVWFEELGVSRLENPLHRSGEGGLGQAPVWSAQPVEFLRQHAREQTPPAQPKAAPPDDRGAARPPSDEFELRVTRRGPREPSQKKLDRVRPPDRVVSTGFADLAHADGALDHLAPLSPSTRYYYWLEISERPAVGALAPSKLTAELPSDAELTVVLFAPDADFLVEHDEVVGRLQLHPEGPATVLAQPAQGNGYSGVPQSALEVRLLFPLRTPAKPGRYRLRSNVYYQGVLIESRIVGAYVGEKPPRGQPALVANMVDYALSHKLAATTLAGVEPHALSLMLNRSPAGNHDFYFFSAASPKPLHRSVTISGDLIENAIREARRGLKRVSWGDEDEFTNKPGQRDRYATPATLPNLRTDLAILAARGCAIYNAVVPKLADDEAALTAALKSTGLLQIAGIESLDFVLPAGMIYDYPFRSQARPFAAFDLCPVFQDAFTRHIPLTETACFQGNCPSRGTKTTVCPSGFWGFRHALGLPLSVGSDRDGEITPIMPYEDDLGIVVAVSTDPDLTARLAHQHELQALRPEWVNLKSWALGDTTDTVLEMMADKKPHFVYFYCHGGLSDSGGSRRPFLSVGKQGKDMIILPETVGQEVHWNDPYPLVFINGCHTTALDADTVLGFVSTLVGRCKACGVIGTEITVFEPLAGAFAMQFWRLFMQGDVTVGEAVRRARLELLQLGNPLGLVYTPFVFAGTRLKKVS